MSHAVINKTAQREECKHSSKEADLFITIGRSPPPRCSAAKSRWHGGVVTRQRDERSEIEVGMAA